MHVGGVNMNTWVVGHAPVGHQSLIFPRPQLIEGTGGQLQGEKTFFMKARIMAGQPNLKANQLGVVDLKWLCKEEVERVVRPQYWSAIKHMLTER